MTYLWLEVADKNATLCYYQFEIDNLSPHVENYATHLKMPIILVELACLPVTYIPLNMCLTKIKPALMIFRYII